MPIMTKPPEWHNQGSEPPENKKVTGWEIDERPPAGWFNWLFHRIYQSLLELAGAIEDHTADRENPHEVIPGQIGAETPAGAQAKIDVHEAKAAPHSGHATTTALNNHVNDKNNPHGVTAAQVGAATAGALNDHVSAAAPHSGHETPSGAQAKVNTHANTKATLAQLGHVNHSVLTTTLNTTWTGAEAPFTKVQTVNGLLATDTPIVDVVLSGDFETDEARIEAWAGIYRITTADNAITLYATEKPAVELPIQLKVVR